MRAFAPGRGFAEHQRLLARLGGGGEQSQIGVVEVTCREDVDAIPVHEFVTGVELLEVAGSVHGRAPDRRDFEFRLRFADGGRDAPEGLFVWLRPVAIPGPAIEFIPNSQIDGNAEPPEAGDESLNLGVELAGGDAVFVGSSGFGIGGHRETDLQRREGGQRERHPPPQIVRPAGTKILQGDVSHVDDRPSGFRHHVRVTGEGAGILSGAVLDDAPGFQAGAVIGAGLELDLCGSRSGGGKRGQAEPVANFHSSLHAVNCEDGRRFAPAGAIISCPRPEIRAGGGGVNPGAEGRRRLPSPRPPARPRGRDRWRRRTRRGKRGGFPASPSESGRP